MLHSFGTRIGAPHVRHLGNLRLFEASGFAFGILLPPAARDRGLKTTLERGCDNQPSERVSYTVPTRRAEPRHQLRQAVEAYGPARRAVDKSESGGGARNSAISIRA